MNEDPSDAPEPSRREFVSCAAAAAAGLRPHLVRPGASSSSRGSACARPCASSSGSTPRPTAPRSRSADTPALPGVLFGYALDISPLHRLPPLRLRLRRGEQPVAGPADPLDPGALHGEGEGGGLLARRSLLQSAAGAGGGPLLRPGPVPAVPEPARAPRSARSAPPGRSRTASSSSTTTGASAAGTAWPPAPTARVTSTGRSPRIPKAELNPNTHYLGNRPRPKGVVEKCTFCIQRTRAGRYPACVEVCPVGARKFGNLLDPESEIRYIIENKRVLVLKEELNTVPKLLLLLRHVRRPVSTVQLFTRFTTGSLRLVLRGNAAYWSWIGALLVLIVSGALAFARQVEDGPRRHRHARPGQLGLLHRQLHLPGGRRRRRRRAGHPRLRVRLETDPADRGLRRAAGGQRHRHVPALRARGHRPPGPLLASAPAGRDT